MKCHHHDVNQFENIYVVTLAMSDALMAVLCMPMSLVLLITGEWPFSSAVCHFQGFFCFFCALYSLLLMTATAVNRYFRVVKPNLYRQRFKVKSTCISVVAMTLFAAKSITHRKNKKILGNDKQHC